MPIIGEESLFALEYNVAPFSDYKVNEGYKDYILGTFRLWISSDTIGDLREPLNLGMSRWSAEQILTFSSYRSVPQSDRMLKNELFSVVGYGFGYYIDSKKYNTFSKKGEKFYYTFVKKLSDQQISPVTAFNLSQLGDDCFSDRSPVILVNEYYTRYPRQRILYQKSEWEGLHRIKVTEKYLPKDYVDKCLCEYVRQIKELEVQARAYRKNHPDSIMPQEKNDDE